MYGIIQKLISSCQHKHIHYPNNYFEYFSIQLFFFIPQTSLITVEEPKGTNLYVPLTLIREKGTYGSVTVNFEVSPKNTVLYFLFYISNWSKEDSWGQRRTATINHYNEMFPNLVLITMRIHVENVQHWQIFGGPNPASEDLSPDRGNLTIPPGQAVLVFSLLIHDDKVELHS